MPKISKIPKKFIIIGAAAVLLIAGGVSAYVATRPSDTKSDTAQKASGSDSKNEESTSQSEEKISETSPSPTPTDAPAPAPPGVTVTIEYVQQSGNAIQIAAYSNASVAGDCTVTFKKGANTVTKTVSSYVNAAGKNICDFPVAKCLGESCQEPFIKRSDFAEAGQWDVVVSFLGGGVNGTSAHQTITIT